MMIQLLWQTNCISFIIVLCFYFWIFIWMLVMGLSKKLFMVCFLYIFKKNGLSKNCNWFKAIDRLRFTISQYLVSFWYLDVRNSWMFNLYKIFVYLELYLKHSLHTSNAYVFS